jgi:hypothetical protein
MNRSSENNQVSPSRIAMGCGGALLIFLLFSFTLGQSIFGYWFVNIDSTEVGIPTKFGAVMHELDANGSPVLDENGKPKMVVFGPGQYTDIFNFGADVTEITVSGIQFTVTDPEVALAGPEQKNIQQTVGITVAGTVFRPGLTPRGTDDPKTPDIDERIPALNENLWRDNRPLYTNDDTLRAKIEELAKQAMKVCVGPRTLAGATVGSDRNDLASCIDAQLTSQANAFAIDVQSVTVPDVILPPEVASSIKELSAANQSAQLAVANATLAVAQGQQQQAVILANAQATAVGQNFVFEAQSTQAAAKEQSIIAAGQVQAAQATNDAALLVYQKAQAQLKLEIALLNAQSENAQIERLAAIYQANPQYAAVIIQTAFAQGLQSVSKVFYIPTDTKSLNVIGGVNGSLVNQDGAAVPIVPLAPAVATTTP